MFDEGPVTNRDRSRISGNRHMFYGMGARFAEFILFFWSHWLTAKQTEDTNVPL